MPRNPVDIVHQSRHVLEYLMIDPLQDIIMASRLGSFNLVCIINVAAAVRKGRQDGTREGEVPGDSLQVIHN
jgi:hypothetical protein